MLDNLWIVITSINEPSSAIKKYLELASKFDFSVLIVGDTITPDTPTSSWKPAATGPAACPTWASITRNLSVALATL